MSGSRRFSSCRTVLVCVVLLVFFTGVFWPDSATAQGQVIPLQRLTKLPERDDGFRSTPTQMQPSGTLEIPDGVRIEEPYAWNRADCYGEPDFEAFFPDDPEGGRQLDALFGGQLGGGHSDGEVLAVARRGLRNTRRHPTLILAEIGKGFVWGVKDQDPRAIELLYHASDSPQGDVAHYALYHGLTVVKDRSDNLVRTLIERYATYDREIQGRILWGFKRYGDRDDTAARLKRVLDDAEGFDEAAIVAAVDLYQDLTGKPYPELSRFTTAGLFVVAFESDGLETREELRNQMIGWIEDPDAIAEFVVRIDEGKAVGVGLVRGIRNRERVLDSIEATDQVSLKFCQTLAPAVLQGLQLREFARFLTDGLPEHARPVYAAPPAREKFAWNATEGYVAPDFFGYFPDDEQAGIELDAMYKDYGRDTQDFTAREILEKIRRGLRHSRLPSQQLMSWAGQVCGWPLDPMAREIAYHGADPKADQRMRHDAVYFGLRGWWDKTPNVLRLFAEILITEPHDYSLGRNTRGDILWSFRNKDGEKKIVAGYLAEALERHADYRVEQLADITAAYEELTGNKPPRYGQYSLRGRFVIAFRDSTSNTPAELQRRAEETFGADSRWLHVVAREGKGAPAAIAVVQGMDGVEWGLKTMRANNFVADMACPIGDLEEEAVEKFRLEEWIPTE